MSAAGHTMEGPLLQTFNGTTLIKGQPTQIERVEIYGQVYSISRGVLTTLKLEHEWYEDVRDPFAVIDALNHSINVKPDIFTFWQRVPELEPKYDLYSEWESVAALPIESFDHWFTKQISSRMRSQIRKAQKDGVEVRQCSYDDDFVRGMTEIFNEAPIRQGRKFWHYGKDFETIKRQFSKYLFREEMIGAYFQGEMIGFMMLGHAGNYAVTGQIISKIEHRDKATNNVLISKAVEVCEKRGLPYLVYLHWTNDSLAEFKRRCGFVETRVPRYFVPLTRRGALALKAGVHKGLIVAIPDRIKAPLKKLRKFWFEKTGNFRS